MADVVIVVSILFAVVAGALLNRRWAVRHPSDGLSLGDLFNPLATIAAILLAFVMVEALSSFDRARERSTQEAAIVDREAESAHRLVDEDDALHFEGDLVCYARAVRAIEWPSMVISGDPSAGVDVWSDSMERTIERIDESGGDDELDRLIDTDNERSDARLARLAEADPSIPIGLNLLMLASIIFSVVGLATFVNPSNGPKANAAIILTFGLIIGGALIIIVDLDHPFDGFERVPPIAMERTQRTLEAHVTSHHPTLVYPCDADGSRRRTPDVRSKLDPA